MRKLVALLLAASVFITGVPFESYAQMTGAGNHVLTTERKASGSNAQYVETASDSNARPEEPDGGHESKPSPNQETPKATGSNAALMAIQSSETTQIKVTLSVDKAEVTDKEKLDFQVKLSEIPEEMRGNELYILLVDRADEKRMGRYVYLDAESDQYESSFSIPYLRTKKRGEHNFYVSVNFQGEEFQSEDCKVVIKSDPWTQKGLVIAASKYQAGENAVPLEDIFQCQEDTKVKTVSLDTGKLTEEQKALFAKLPVYQDGKIVFTLHSVENVDEVSLPIVIETEDPFYVPFQGNISIRFFLHRQARTKEEIKAMYKKLSYSLSGRIKYDITPSTTKYIAGKVSSSSLTDGVNAVNFVRYVAGLPADVALSEEYNNYAQHGAVLLADIDTLSHTPAKPSAMPEEFYELGYKGTKSSNIFWSSGRRNLAFSVIKGYMDDGDASNQSRVGHRRWVLNPSMKLTGFGACDGYSAMYAFDMSRQNVDIQEVFWPAEVMPYELFDGPFSVMLGNSYDRDSTTADQISVTVTSKEKKKSWTLSKDSKSGYFNVDFGGYGMNFCIIFKPSVSFSATDTLTIQVDGLRQNGEKKQLSYKVEFFKLDNSSSGSSGGSGGSSGGSGGSSGGSGGSSGGGSHSGGSGSSGGSGGGHSGGSSVSGNGSKATGGPSQSGNGQWKQDSVGWWYQYTGGGYAKDSWKKINNKWYYFNKDGYMLTDWQLVDGQWYFMNPSGDMAQGWLFHQGKWYYLEPSGGTMTIGWRWINGKCYYFDGSGVCLMNTRTPDGYQVDASGAWVQ